MRFGNLLGSRDSALRALRAQIAVGGPGMATEPKVTGFFMTIPEAVHLALQAVSVGEDAETLTLGMGG